MDEGLIVKRDGRVVGVVVPVRGGFMFFSSDGDLKRLEATVFPRVEMVTRRVAEIGRAGNGARELVVMEAGPNSSAPAAAARA